MLSNSVFKQMSKSIRADLARSCVTFDKSIGITQRAVPSVTLWEGILRHRWCDFMVNEIRKDGTVVHLRDCHLGTPQNRDTFGVSAEKPVADPDKPEIPQEKLQVLQELTSPGFVEGLVKLYTAPTVDKTQKRVYPDPVVSEKIDDRLKRSLVHQEIRTVFLNSIDTTTNHDGCIKATRFSPFRYNSNRNAKKPNVNCPGQGEYVHFTMFKENRDTMEAAHLVSRLLNMKYNPPVHAAGTKDRRAATAQRCSVRLRNAADLAALNPRLNRVKTGDYERSNIPLRMGELMGNEFTLIVKDCHLAKDFDKPLSERGEALKAAIKPSMEHMYQHGWINFFGHQRFGSYKAGTHKTGMLIMCGKFEEAVNTILEYDEKVLRIDDFQGVYTNYTKHDEYNRSLAIKTFREQKDSTPALKHLPTRFAAEKAIIGHLGRGPVSSKDYAGALLKVPRGLRTLYLHAYQSFIWNNAASKRWELYGSKVVEGDLVAVETPKLFRETVDQEGDEVVYAEDPADEDTGAITAHVVTAEEANMGKFTIFDVVLPAPGYNTIIPENEVGSFYKEFMAKPHYGGLDPTNMPRGHKEFTAEGRYRRLMAKFIKEPSIRILEYCDSNRNLIPSDLDLVMEMHEQSSQKEQNSQKEQENHGNQGDQGDQGKEKEAKRMREGGEDPEAEMHPAKKAKPEGASTDGLGGAEKPEGIDAAWLPPKEEAKKAEVFKVSAGTAEELTKPNKVAVILKFQLGKSAYATIVTRELGLTAFEAS